MRTWLTLSSIAMVSCCVAFAEPLPIANVQRGEPVVFEKDILPILQRSCLACHSASERQGDLVLETPDAMRKGGDAGPAIVPGRGAESLLLTLASHQQEPLMPPSGNDVNAKPLTAEELGLLRLWIDQGARGTGGVAMPSPKPWQSLPDAIGPVYGVVLSVDGQYAPATRANQLFIYHVPTGKMVTNLVDPAIGSPVAHRELIQSLALSVDGDLLASGGFREVKLWRRPSDVQLANLAAGGPVTAMAVSPDGKRLATTGANHSVRLWNAESGQPGATMTGHSDFVTALRFTPDGSQVVSSSQDQTIRIWNTEDGSPAGTIETTAIVNAVELVATTAATEQQPQPLPILVSGGTDNFIRTWSLPAAPPMRWETSLAEAECFAVNRAGDLFAMSRPDGTIRVVSRKRPQQDAPLSMQTVAEWKSDAGAVASNTFVPVTPVAEGAAANLDILATTDADGEVSLWQLPDHQLLARWRGGNVSVTALASSADGAMLASGASDGKISLWNLAVDPVKPLDTPSGAAVTVVAFNAQRTVCAVAGVSGGKPALLVRNLENGQVTHALLGHEATIRCAAFATDGKRLVTGADDKTVRVWNLDKRQQPEQAKLEGHAASVTAVAFSADGQQVLSGTADNAVRLWNLADGMPLKDFAGHAGAIVELGFFNGQPFSVSADRSVRFWNAADGLQARTFNDQGTTVRAALRPDGQRIALAGDDKQIRIYQMDNGQLLQTLTGHADAVTSLGFSPDGQRLTSTSVAAGRPGETIVWDVQANPPRLLESFAGQTHTASYFAAQSDRLLVGDTSGTLVFRPLRFVRHVDGNQQPITTLLFHSNGQTLFTTAKDGSFRGYATANGQQTFATSHGAAINSLAISPNEQVLATAGDNAVVRLWQTNGGGYGPQQLTGLTGPAGSVAFSADGTKVVVGSGGEKPQVTSFDLQTGVQQQRFTSHTKPVALLARGSIDASSPDLISASPDGVWQWSVHGMRHIQGHGAAVTSLAAVPNAPRQVLSGSLDTTIRRWNLDNGQQLSQFNHGGAVYGIDVRADGQRLASVSDNHTAKLWNINGQQIAEMRGDVRRKTQAARLTQQLNAANQRVNIAKQQLDAAEKDVPAKTEAEKKASEALAAANKDVADKKAALEKAAAEKVAAEKSAIEAAAVARQRLLAKAEAEDAAKLAAAEVPLAQQKAAQLAAASAAAPNDEAIKKAVADAQAAVTAAQQKAQQIQQAVQAPVQAAQTAVNTANEAAQKVTTVQKPFNDALAALRTSESAQNLASQQQVVAARELKTSQDTLPGTKQAMTGAEATVEALKKLVESANQQVNDADLAIRSVRFSPDGTVLATAGDFTSLHTWDGETGAALAAFAGHTETLSGVAFLDNGRFISTSTDQSVRIWDLNPSWRLERTIGAVDQPNIISHRVTSLDFNADATQLLVGGGVPSRNGELHIFNVADGTRTLFLPQAHDDVISAARFSPDGKRVASAGADKYLRTWDVASAQPLRRFEGHTNYVLDVSWKGDGQTLVSASADQTIKVWNSETGDQERTIPNFGKQVTAVRYIGETDNIVSTCGDKLVRMHNAANGGNFRNFSGATQWLHCVSITPDSNVLAVGAADGTLLLWNGNTGQQLRVIKAGE